MFTFLSIITNIILPIFILIAVGFIAQKKLKLDIRTFTKINLYILTPAIIFTKIYYTEATWELFRTVFIFLIALLIIMFLLGELVSRLLHYPRGIKKIFVNSLLFFNAANYGLPLIEITFHNPLTTAAQIFIILIQTVLGNTFGVFQASSGKTNNRQALKNMLLMPAIYVLILVVIVKSTNFVIPQFLLIPLDNIANAFIGMALITLGIQLAEVKLTARLKDILLASFLRLIIAPFIAFFLVQFLGIEGILAKSLIVGVSTPTAVNMAVIAREFESEPEYASQIVFVSTLLSALTVSGLIYLLEYV
ncbi:MAG TPA: AEC family transporter [Peptococcaceae bacterium]|nr:AEC family transporter [Peptococcaceae bacterium]